MSQVTEVVDKIFNNVKKVIVGKDDCIKLVLCSWFAGGHILIEDFPGTGKTMLARAIAKSTQVDFNRVQFTPDLLPSDILGTSIYRQDKHAFELLKGPIFTTILLADEINRATPRTQSGLLESMAEGQVTVERQTITLNPLFFVMATQNPVEQYGTFPLPEAQLDRFMMKISMGYPRIEEECRVVRNQNESHPINTISAVETEEHIRQLKALVPKVEISDQVVQYAATLVSKTRSSSEIKLGASPRATIALIRCAQAMALMEGKNHVRPNHVFHLVKPVLTHRLSVASSARLAGRTASQILDDIIKDVSVPVS